MSNLVYGYIEYSGAVKPVEQAIHQVIEPLPIGLHQIEVAELANFPTEYLPSGADGVLPFNISDYKGIGGAECLVDGLDYAPEANIGLPTQADERLEILLIFLEGVCRVQGVKRLAVTINQCNQIDAVTLATPTALRETIVRDMSEDAPCDLLYIVDIKPELRT